MRLRCMRNLAGLVGAGGLLSGCWWYGDETAGQWATKREIMAAAEECGVPDFEPQRAGVGWTAYVDDSVPDAEAKEDCIYDRLAEGGRLITR